MQKNINYQDELIDAMLALDEAKVLEYAKAMIDNKYTPNSIIACLNIGVSCVGNYFERGEYFIGDLIICGMIYREVLDLITPLLPEKEKDFSGKVVIGVAEGDIHDIGKDIVADLLRAEHFEVIDLGVDVHPEKFASAIVTHKPDILLLSGLLSIAADSMEVTMDYLKEHDLRDSVKILIGGACASETLMHKLGADGWAYDTMETVAFCKRVMDEKK